MTYLKFRRPWYVSLARIFRLVTVMSASHDVFYQEFVQPRSVKLCAWAKKTTYLIHINTGSLVKKYDRFVFLLEQFSFIFNVIMLTEIWFNSFNSVPTLPGYNCFFANRTNSRGGGIAIFISGDTGFFEEVPQFSSVTEDYEDLRVRQHDVLYSVLYRPPSGNTEQFKSFVDGLLECASLSLRLFLGGDFNINLLGDRSCSNDMIHRIVA